MIAASYLSEASLVSLEALLATSGIVSDERVSILDEIDRRRSAGFDRYRPPAAGESPNGDRRRSWASLNGAQRAAAVLLAAAILFAPLAMIGLASEPPILDALLAHDLGWAAHATSFENIRVRQTADQAFGCSSYAGLAAVEDATAQNPDFRLIDALRFGCRPVQAHAPLRVVQYRGTKIRAIVYPTFSPVRDSLDVWLPSSLITLGGR